MSSKTDNLTARLGRFRPRKRAPAVRGRDRGATPDAPPAGCALCLDPAGDRPAGVSDPAAPGGEISFHACAACVKGVAGLVRRLGWAGVRRLVKEGLRRLAARSAPGPAGVPIVDCGANGAFPEASR
jgi:hypothetical protein